MKYCLLTCVTAFLAFHITSSPATEPDQADSLPRALSFGGGGDQAIGTYERDL